MSKSNFKLLSIAGAVVIGLSACSGDNSETTVKLSGVVADGYLENALVCLDLNENKACDADEPQTLTDIEGKYSFDAGSGDSEKFPVISVISAATKDADDPSRVMAPYVMSAPAGRPEFISPMTTMIQTELESNPGITVESAEKTIKGNLGYSASSTVDLFKDYVAAKADASDADKEDYKRIHRIARVTARTLEANHALIETAAEAAGLNKDDVLNELVRLVVKDVIANLTAILEDVDDNIAQTDEDYKPGLFADTLTPLDTQSLEEDIASEEAVSDSAFVDITALLKKGIHFLRGEWSDTESQRTYDIEKITIDTAKTSDNLVMTAETWSGTDHWTNKTDTDDNSGDNCQAITAIGIVTYNCGDSETIKDNGDGTASLISSDTLGNTVELATIRGTEVNLSGKRIRGVIGNEKAWEKVIPGNALFAAGSFAYRWNFTTVNDVYNIHYEEAPTNGTCADLNYNSTSTMTTTNCLALRSDEGEKVATALANVTDGTTEYYVGNNLVATFSPNANDATKGDIIYIDRNYSNNITTEETLDGTYMIETPMDGSVEVLVFDVPRKFRYEQKNDRDGKLFIVIENGYARLGGIRPAGVSDANNDFSLDVAAVDSVKACFMGGVATDGVGSCPVRLLLRDKLIRDANDRPITAVESGVMIPYVLPTAGVDGTTTLKFSTNDTETRWTLALGDVTVAADEKGWRDGTLTPTELNNAGEFVDKMEGSSVKMLPMKWKVTANGRLKIERNYEIADGSTRPAGSYYDFWVVTQLDNDKTHLRFKRFKVSLDDKQERNFGAYVTLMQ